MAYEKKNPLKYVIACLRSCVTALASESSRCLTREYLITSCSLNKLNGAGAVLSMRIKGTSLQRKVMVADHHP